MTDDLARKVMGGAAIATILGTFLSWATVFIASVSGIDTDYGKGSVAAAGIGGLLLILGKPWWWQAIAPLASGGFAVWFWIKMSQIDTTQGNDFHVSVSVGSGVYLTLIASVVWWLVAMRSRATVRDARVARLAAATEAAAASG
jgi:hypothetical protein